MSKIRRGYGLALALAVLCAISTACGESGDKPTPAVTVTETSVVVSTPSDITSPWEDDEVPADPFTALVVQLVWQEQTEDDKQGLCEGLEFFGPEIVASFIRESEPGQDNSDVDEDLAVEMLGDRCRKEGYLTS